ncbi:hypothetical protein ABIF97_004152 [Bradyrhizobium japonicum]
MPEQMNTELYRKLQELSRHNAVARACLLVGLRHADLRGLVDEGDLSAH